MVDKSKRALRLQRLPRAKAAAMDMVTAESGLAWAGPQAPSMAEPRGRRLEAVLQCDIDAGQVMHHMKSPALSNFFG